MERYGLRLKKADLFGWEAGQPNVEQHQKRYSSGHGKKVKNIIIATLLKVPANKGGGRLKVVKELSQKHSIPEGTIMCWLYKAENKINEPAPSSAAV